ncbi:MAG: DNA alkylation repair protein [Longimicrobiales bacterium]|nr:DNA alkylation repair protein [Longimicrobiales bacterium]
MCARTVHTVGPDAPPIPDLQARLQAVAEPETREWWTRYLKGAASFRGVPMPEIRRVVAGWVADHALLDQPDDRLLALVDALFRQPDTEDKLAAILFIQEWLLPAGRVRWPVALGRWSRLFEDGAIADWNTCDWFCVKVLGPLIRRHGEACGRAVADWIDGDTLWQRRASTVAFVNLVRGDPPFPGLPGLVLRNCRALVSEEERFAQTAAGWVLRELSRTEPEAVEAFLAEHGDAMTAEARARARSHLDDR